MSATWLSYFVASLFLLSVQGGAEVISDLRRPFAVVRPVEDRTQLLLDKEGLDVIRSISGPVVPVVVIGPYRSGKSFLLNQLLGVGCNDGFEVGHTRNTQTKGVWLWGQSQQLEANGATASIVYMDTEGFEASGKSDAYDDRIFALSTVIASVLVYNLPETVRESDIEKLSFAVELADAFFGESQEGARQQGLEAGNMLWLIQRDFLQGKTVGAMVADALAEQPNPHHDKDIDQVNRIRQSLSLIAHNSTAFGLAQPHLDRTRLCTLEDSALDPAYVRQRSRLQSLVKSLARPKNIRGMPMTGPGLALLIERMVSALNARDIPSAGSMLEYFNKELLYQCRDAYVARLEELPIPVAEKDLLAWSDQAAEAAYQRFDKEKFGGGKLSRAATLRDALATTIDKEFGARKTANVYRSSVVCEAAVTRCEDGLEAEQRMRLPSTGRFRAKFKRCETAFEKACVGPSLISSAERLQKAWRREESRFTRDYNDKIFNGLVIFALADILIFRFIIRISIAETAGWIGFVFLQVYPKLYITGGNLYDATWWKYLVRVWEAGVWSGLDLEFWAPILLPIGICVWLGRKAWQRFGKGQWATRQRGRLTKRVVHVNGQSGDIRDLDV
mmetsp:Transcript_7092/g.20767  ORF Transcript_7092/g.20767 Transcript_7092/m.20767 type:complete len:616 (-) Transcript_7092:489-2336(-)|eukprot:CAMPEP_0206139506 /NCGR_PEP_ID=MMETSP1473-20131121/6256_1 /ASSEMBLY_ACC=CAM_ASM_001109 /TAXON_ID=1461547 /ORGANISM="Stichococcus sp, Strain RCC1054" /LENGTH=615 /DNA_ID=CAMNT_0053533325 /DNA_START=291 /DNA_END=2138 /DNA_ORIENTATION=+